MLLILIWILFMMNNMTYFFSVIFLVLMVMLLMLMFFSNVLFLKYLVVLIYVSGVVIFILYISCLCWNSKFSMSFLFLIFIFIISFIYDLGLFFSFTNVGEFMWMFIFFSMLFMNLVNVYSLLLFKVSGSLRF